MSRPITTALATAGALAFAPAALALTPVSNVDLTPDVTVTLDSQTIDDEDVAADDVLGGTITPVALGALPEASDVSAYHAFGPGQFLLTFDTAVDLPGGVFAEAADVVRYDGATYSIEFDASSAGVPPGARADAVSRTTAGNLLLSFDTTVSLSSTTFDDEDLIEFDGATFTSRFDGSAAGIDPALDLDGAHFFPGSGFLALSFDGSGSVGGVAFDDEDVLEYDTSGPTWEMAWDTTVERPEWTPGADVNGVHLVPEPSGLVMLAAGCGLLIALARRRGRRAA